MIEKYKLKKQERFQWKLKVADGLLKSYHILNSISWQWKPFRTSNLCHQLTLNPMVVPVFLLRNPSPCSVGGCRGSYLPAGITSTRLSPLDAPPQRSNCEWCAVFPLNSIFPAQGLHCTLNRIDFDPRSFRISI